MPEAAGPLAQRSSVGWLCGSRSVALSGGLGTTATASGVMECVGWRPVAVTTEIREARVLHDRLCRTPFARAGLQLHGACVAGSGFKIQGSGLAPLTVVPGPRTCGPGSGSPWIAGLINPMCPLTPDADPCSLSRALPRSQCPLAVIQGLQKILYQSLQGPRKPARFVGPVIDKKGARLTRHFPIDVLWPNSPRTLPREQALDARDLFPREACPTASWWRPRWAGFRRLEHVQRSKRSKRRKTTADGFRQ